MSPSESVFVLVVVVVVGGGGVVGVVVCAGMPRVAACFWVLCNAGVRSCSCPDSDGCMSWCVPPSVAASLFMDRHELVRDDETPCVEH